MPDTLILLTECLTALIVSIAITGKVMREARQHLLDMPNHRSSHSVPTPTGGGMGFLMAFAGCSLMAEMFDPAFRHPSPTLLILLGLPLALVGYIDDRKGLSRKLRYGVQLLCALAVVYLFGPYLVIPAKGVLWWALAGLTVVGVTAVINMVNFMDGMDGLVGGTSMVMLLFIGYWLAQPIWFLLAACLGGFLFWNWPPAKIFMGDVGSTVLGLLFCIAVLAAQQQPANQWQHSYLVIAAPLLGDSFYTIVRRLLRGENILKAHHSHIYQRLMRSGLSHKVTSCCYIGLTALCGLLVCFVGIYGALIAAGLCLAGMLAAEVRIARKQVPFTRRA